MPTWYTIRSRKRDENIPDTNWSNVYEVVKATGTLNREQANQVMGAIREFEVSFHCAVVEMYDMTCSTWVADEVAEEEDGLYTFESAPQVGSVVVGAPIAPYEEALYVVKVPSRGNKGRAMYRGCILQQELTGRGRKFVLTSAGRITQSNRIQDGWTQLLADLTNANVQLGMVSYPRTGTLYPATPQGVKQVPEPVYSTVPYERSVLRLQVGGVSHLDMDHGYFDQA